MKPLVLTPLTADDYRPYGDVLAAGTRPGRVVNQGFARRFDRLVDVRSTRPDAALNTCVFRCLPRSLDDLVVTLLERHADSTQVFAPLGQAHYLAVVALGREQPDLATLVAFEVTGPVGISYHPGVWHHPLIALDRETDFLCLVHEDGTAGDCDVVMLGDHDKRRVARPPFHEPDHPDLPRPLPALQEREREDG